MTAKLDHEAADLKRRLNEALAERDEAEARQAAIADILQLINTSQGDLSLVFDAILKKAHDLCGPEVGVLLRSDGECYWPLAAQLTSTRFLEPSRQGFRRGTTNSSRRALPG